MEEEEEKKNQSEVDAVSRSIVEAKQVRKVDGQ